MTLAVYREIYAFIATHNKLDDYMSREETDQDTIYDLDTHRPSEEFLALLGVTTDYEHYDVVNNDFPWFIMRALIFNNDYIYEVETGKIVEFYPLGIVLGRESGEILLDTIGSMEHALVFRDFKKDYYEYQLADDISSWKDFLWDTPLEFIEKYGEMTYICNSAIYRYYKESL